MPKGSAQRLRILAKQTQEPQILCQRILAEQSHEPQFVCLRILAKQTHRPQNRVGAFWPNKATE